MVGFIGALSSALCILILVFITLIIGYIDSLLPDKSIFRIDEITYRYPIDSYYVTEQVIFELGREIRRLKEGDTFIVENVNLGCTYDFDIDKKSAENLSVYNSIKVSNSDFGVDVSLGEIELDKYRINYCYADLIGIEYE